MYYKDKVTGVRYESLYDYRNQTGKVFPSDPDANMLEQLGLEEIEEEPTPHDLEVEKALALDRLNRDFLAFRENQATMQSSLGFKVDATERALIDVGGLIAISDGVKTPITFMDANNEPHDLTHEQFVALQKEIAANGSKVYAKKWGYRQAIINAQSVEELQAIHVSFE